MTPNSHPQVKDPNQDDQPCADESDVDFGFNLFDLAGHEVAGDHEEGDESGEEADEGCFLFGGWGLGGGCYGGVANEQDRTKEDDGDGTDPFQLGQDGFVFHRSKCEFENQS